MPMPRAAAALRAMRRQSLGTLLRKRSSVRQAIILREVLGPPRGLQALDDLRSFRPARNAGVAELADALDSKSSASPSREIGALDSARTGATICNAERPSSRQ
jgi:hypothetical protein